MSAFIGVWHLKESEQYEEFLEAMRINFFLRTFTQIAKPSMNISLSGDTWTIETLSTMKAMLIRFKLGEEFTEKREDGNEVRSVVKMDGDAMVYTQFADEAKKLKEVKITHSVIDNQMIVVAECCNIVSTRKYIRQ